MTARTAPSSSLNRSRLALAAACGLAVVSSAPPAAAAEHDFSVDLYGYPNITPTLNPCILRNTPTASGTASELGHVTFTAEEYINVCSFPSKIVSHFTLEDDDGDTVYGRLDVLLAPRLDGSFVATGPFVILGGTGDFEGASGGGTWTVTFNLIPTLTRAHVTADGVLDS